jgi:hypothetical protein
MQSEPKGRATSRTLLILLAQNVIAGTFPGSLLYDFAILGGKQSEKRGALFGTLQNQ